MPLRSTLVWLESRWFDLLNGTHTRATAAELSGLGHNPANGFWYIPTRPSAARKILRSLPIQSPQSYTFVDVGCGKGRMLRLAARHPFHAIVGIDRDPALCTIARSNIVNLRDPRITVVQTDARTYQFPQTPLVLYLFNPFGEHILHTFLSNLELSLATHPRHVVIALLYPEYAYVIEKFSRYNLVKDTHPCRTYESSS